MSVVLLREKIIRKELESILYGRNPTILDINSIFYLLFSRLMLTLLFEIAENALVKFTISIVTRKIQAIRPILELRSIHDIGQSMLFRSLTL